MLKKYKLFSVKNPILKTPYKHCQRSLESAGSAAASGSPPALRRAVPRPVQWGRLPGALMGNKARLRHVIAASPPGSLIPRSQGCAGGGLAASCEGLQEGWGGGCGDEGRVTLFSKGIVLGSSITCAPVKERLRQENPLCLTIPGNQSYAIDRCLRPRRSAFQRLQLQMLAERTAKKGISDDCNLPFQGHS